MPGFLTDRDIIEKRSELFPNHLSEFDDNAAERASYDLSLGDEVYISREEYPQKLTQEKPFVSIPRGQFALLHTYETIKLPKNYLGLISVKFRKKARGLINVSGFHVDPGYEGKIVFSVYNAGPTDVVLKYREKTFMIFFYELSKDAEKPYNKPGYKALPVEIVTSLRGTSASLSDVDKRVAQLETWGKVFWAILIALISAIIALFIQ
ncbi:dCTP deaminase [Dehalogenimonas etheniformans]|uniref:Uncharacterized protein n=1 Tax=Dehalogenimonas etheniformans TaxID=1536648 RepID=A0A2P5P6C6_9CHLR|nr:hypothetical protein [Dehalogenimonas etheniformans]PPD57858.1 hypothetical protein JP09_006030 [Dehalogenimonas etheniformans]QNT75490.1 hypothetical protein HX448_01705 [Dehalogenimonas etheniformans]